MTDVGALRKFSSLCYHWSGHACFGFGTSKTRLLMLTLYHFFPAFCGCRGPAKFFLPMLLLHMRTARKCFTCMFILIDITFCCSFIRLIFVHVMCQIPRNTVDEFYVYGWSDEVVGFLKNREAEKNVYLAIFFLFLFFHCDFFSFCPSLRFSYLLDISMSRPWFDFITPNFFCAIVLFRDLDFVVYIYSILLFIFCKL